MAAGARNPNAETAHLLRGVGAGHQAQGGGGGIGGAQLSLCPFAHSKAPGCSFTYDTHGPSQHLHEV